LEAVEAEEVNVTVGSVKANSWTDEVLLLLLLLLLLLPLPPLLLLLLRCVSCAALLVSTFLSALLLPLGDGCPAAKCGVTSERTGACMFKIY
jgi:hypothetical protein